MIMMMTIVEYYDDDNNLNDDDNDLNDDDNDLNDDDQVREDATAYQVPTAVSRVLSKVEANFLSPRSKCQIQHFETAKIQNMIEKVSYYWFKAAILELNREVGKLFWTLPI